MRRWLALATGALVAAAVGMLLWDIPAVDGGSPPPSPSTVESTLVDRDGDGFLELGPGEPLRDRMELAAASPEVRELAVFAQVSDAHVRDEESPARASLLDRLGPPFESTFRPQEALSAQTLAATVAALDELGPQAVLVTGDLIDSAQANELEQALAALDGGVVDPSSGDEGYEGPQARSNADPFFYRPDVDAPRHPGLLDRAQRPFSSAGLDAPWYPVLGNHDVLVQGVVPPSRSLRALAVGSRALVELDTDVAVPRTADPTTPALVDDLLGGGLPGTTRRVAPDAGRRHLDARQVVERLRDSAGIAGDGARLDYSFPVGPALRVVVLDLVRRGGGSGGRVGARQVAWLRRELRRADRWVVVASHQPLAASAGGSRALAVLDRSPRVVAAIAGHTHENSIEPRDTPAGGYWLIQTASLADYPQQARMFRLLETEAGVALETWMVDHSGSDLAATSRELAFLDAQGGRPDGSRGGREDRNARLYR